MFYRIASFVFLAVSVNASEAQQVEVVFVTEIRNASLVSFQVGEKSRQSVTLDFIAETATQKFSTGVTNVGIDLPSVRDSFKLVPRSFDGGKTSFSVSGTTGSFLSFFGDIDYQFDVLLNTSSQTLKISGCHNEYPSYYITVDGRTVYDREQSGAVLAGALLGDCDIDVSISGKSY